MKNLSKLTLAMVIAAVAVVPILLSGQEDRDQREILAQSEYNDSLTVGNEAFTEPVEQIKVAAAEMGIITRVHVRKGDLVAEGDLLIEMDMSVIEATRRVAESKANNVARLRAAEVELETKTKRYEKLIELVREGAGSPEEVERARADSEVAQHNIDAIREEAAQYALEVKQYESQMERRRVRSPINGVITELTTKPGEFVSTNEPHVATVVRLDTLRAEFHIPTSRAIQMNQGDVVAVLFRDGKTVEAIVEYVAPITQADSGRVEVDVLIENRHGALRSGVSCRLLEGTIRQSSRRNSIDSSIERTLNHLRR